MTLKKIKYTHVIYPCYSWGMNFTAMKIPSNLDVVVAQLVNPFMVQECKIAGGHTEVLKVIQIDLNVISSFK